MHNPDQNFWLAKGPEIKSIPWGVKIYLQISEMPGNKHIGYFYEKGNFMADTILKLR